MEIPLPKLEPRLKRRYQKLVTEQMSPKHSVAPGLRALAGKYSAFASTQAAWRFYANETVDVTHLVAPLHEYAHRCVEQEMDQVCLIADDWSEIDYDAHEAKDDRIELNSSKRLGYYLHSALLLSDRTGAPLVPLHASLWAADGIHTTRSPKVEPAHPHVDEVTQLMVATKQIGLARPCVYLIDRALDSVGHYRVWQRQQQMFVVRANARPRVAFAGRQMALSDVAEQVVMRPGEAVEISGSVTGQQFAGEAEVVITRAARPRQRPEQQGPRKSEPGEPVRLRLIVCEIRLPDEAVHERWLLLTNVPEQVSAETVVRWYYWRWKIECYFKLLKRAGHEMESWRQESAEAIAKRLLVTSMACVVVWQVARAEGEEAEQARKLLLRLSGRQTRRNRPYSEPALVAGLWVLLASLDALDHYSLEEFRQAARTILPGVFKDRPD
jgi:hypothetical protein